MTRQHDKRPGWRRGQAPWRKPLTGMSLNVRLSVGYKFFICILTHFKLWFRALTHTHTQARCSLARTHTHTHRATDMHKYFICLMNMKMHASQVASKPLASLKVCFIFQASLVPDTCVCVGVCAFRLVSGQWQCNDNFTTQLSRKCKSWRDGIVFYYDLKAKSTFHCKVCEYIKTYIKARRYRIRV